MADPTHGIGILPEDTLYEIFRIVVSIDNPINAPIYLSHCCKSWRSLALSTHALWTFIQVHSSKPNYLDRLNAWLDRSEFSLLEVNISQPKESSDAQFFGYLNDCLAILQPHSHRWRTLTIRVVELPNLDLAWQIFRSTAASLPELKELSLGYTGYGTGRLQSTFNISQAPELLKLSTLVVPGYFVDLRHVPRWEQTPLFKPTLRKLVLESAAYSDSELGFVDCLGLLRQLPLLEELIIQDIILRSPTRPQDRWYNPMIVPELVVTAKNLRIAQFGLRGLVNFRHGFLPLVAHLQAPNLIQLHQQLLSLRFLPAMVAMTKFPFPSLRSIKLVDGMSVDVRLDATKSDATMQFLSRVPHLRYLEFQNTTFYSRNLVTSLENTVRLAVSAMCPQLDTLVLLRCSWAEMA